MYIRDESAEALGTFTISGKCALAHKVLAGCTVYYSALGNLSRQVLQQIAWEAGVHIYVESGIATYINSTFVGVYNTKAGTTTLTLPEDGTYTELFSGKQYTTNKKQVTLPTGETHAQMLILE